VEAGLGTPDPDSEKATRKLAIRLAIALVVVMGLASIADPMSHVLADVLPSAVGGCGGG